MESRKVEEEYATLGEKNLWPVIYLRINQKCQSYPYTCIEAKKTVNKPLNRYRDVNPFDHSRIVLQKGQIFTDYINANLVEVPKANRKYILTQGPLVYTSGHFWLMVWEQKCPAIIMLNKIIEKSEIKCHWYWPHEGGDLNEVSYPDVNMNIAQVSEKDFGYYTIRQLRMIYHDTEETRDIWHFHYTTWPDFEVPQSPNQFLNFLTRVRDYGALDCAGDKGPSIVHCSAGIGRSGTFCLVDSVLVMIEREGQADINIEDILLDMRRYRVGLIQTSEQLRFSYQAIVEGIKRLDPNYVPPPESEEGIYDAAPAEEDEAPPAPPPRGESLGRPPARPLPAIPASASMGNMALSANADSSDSEEAPTPPNREPLPPPPREASSPASPASSPAFYPASPASSPASPAFSPASPASSPAFYPASPASSPASPASSPAFYPASPASSPASPAFSPASPASSPASPAFSPASPVSSPASPASPASSADEAEEDADDDNDADDDDDNPLAEIMSASDHFGFDGGDTLRRRRVEELAERVAAIKKRSRDADRWHRLKRSLYKPIAISVGVLVISIFIYVYIKR